MKRALAILGIFLCAASSLTAAYQYGDYVTLEDGKLIADTSSHLTLKFISAEITKWSTLTVQITDTQGSSSARDVAITGTSLDIGNVNPGDVMKFYLSGALSPTSSFDHFWGEGWDSKAKTYENLVFGVNYGPYDSQYASYQFQVDGSPIPPSGQPLPGVLSLLLCGGGVLGAWYWKARKA